MRSDAGGGSLRDWLVSSARTHFNGVFFVLGAAFGAVLGATEPGNLAEQLSQAQCFEDKKDFESATGILLRAARLAETGGEKGSALATMLNNLGSTMQDQGRYLDAERLYRGSIRIWELSLGDHAVEASIPLNNLASVYLQKGEPKRSAALRRRALAIRSDALGADDLAVARLQANLAADLLAQRNYKESESHCREALAKLGVSPNRALALHTLALVRIEANDFSEALNLVDEALVILERLEPPDTPWLADCLRTKAGLLHAAGRDGCAEATLQRSLGLLEGAPLVYPSLHITVLRQYATLLKSKGRGKEARELEKRASTMYGDLERESLMQHTVSVESLTAPKN